MVFKKILPAVLLSLAGSFIICCTALTVIPAKNENVCEPNQIIRLRVVANSDSSEDQAVKIKVRDGIHYVIAQDIFKITMSSNQEFTESLKGLLKCQHLKFVTEDEFNGTDIKDPLDDIIAMAGDVDQISIF